MTIQEYEKIKQVIQQALRELEEEAIRKGVLFSPQHEQAILEVKRRLLKKAGFNLEEYIKIEEMDESGQNLDKKSINLLLEEAKDQISRKIPTEKDIKGIADIVAQQYIKPPQIINKIVREVIREKPIIKKEYDEAPIEELKRDLLFLQNSYSEDYGKIPKQHSDLLGITPDDHHQEIHSIMYHLDDEHLKQFKDLVEKKDTSHFFGEGIGSGFRPDEIWKQIRATKLVSLRRSDYSLDMSIGQLSDVDITGIANDQIIKWSTDKFVVSDPAAGAWGTITGTLSNQIDLQNALNDKEATDNKRTSFQVTPDDTKYISEKLAKDTLDLKEVLTNKKTTLADNSDIFYPSQKAVRTAVDAKVPYTGATGNVDLGTHDLITTGQASMGSGYVDSVLNLGKATKAADLYIHNGGGIWVYEAGNDFLCSVVCKDGAAEWEFNNHVNVGKSAANRNLYVWGNANVSGDILLGSGKVINFDSGNVTITHSAGILTFNVFPVTPSAAPDDDYEVANKKYVDDSVSKATGVDTKTDNYTFVLGDAGKLILLDSAVAKAFTVPTNASVGFPTGTKMAIMAASSGAITATAAGGVTLNSYDNAYGLAGQWAGAVLIKIATDEWILEGNVE